MSEESCHIKQEAGSAKPELKYYDADACTGRPIADYARSCTNLARHYLSEAMDFLRISQRQSAVTSLGSCRYYLELLIGDFTARGEGASNEEVNVAKEMLKKLDTVRL